MNAITLTLSPWNPPQDILKVSHKNFISKNSFKPLFSVFHYQLLNQTSHMPIQMLTVCVRVWLLEVK